MIIAFAVMASIFAYMFYVYDAGKYEDSRTDGFWHKG